MRQFDVYENPSSASRPYAPYVVVLQSHLNYGIDTVVIAPLLADDDSPLTTLDVAVTFRERALLAAISELSNTPEVSLRRAPGNLSAYEDDFRRALDRLFTGF